MTLSLVSRSQPSDSHSEIIGGKSSVLGKHTDSQNRVTSQGRINTSGDGGGKVPGQQHREKLQISEQELCDYCKTRVI